MKSQMQCPLFCSQANERAQTQLQGCPGSRLAPILGAYGKCIGSSKQLLSLERSRMTQSHCKVNNGRFGIVTPSVIHTEDFIISNAAWSRIRLHDLSGCVTAEQCVHLLIIVSKFL